jgi:hypothetical protein
MVCSTRVALHTLTAVILITGALLLTDVWQIVSGQSQFSAPARQRSNKAALRVANSYYDAVNHLLATGDSALLERQLNDRFGYISTSNSASGSAAELVADLGSLRSAYPDARYVVEDLESREELVFATIRITGGNAGDLASIGLPPLDGTSAEEVLRIRDGSISAAWSSAQNTARFTNIAAVAVPAFGEPNLVPQLRRWTIAPSGNGRGKPGTMLILVVESGTIRIALDADDPGARTVSIAGRGEVPLVAKIPRDLAVGDALIVPGRAGYRYSNLGSEPAQLIAMEMTPHSAAASKPPVASDGVTRTLLARGITLEAGNGGVCIGFGQMTLPGGFRWTHDPVTEGSELVAITYGTLAVSANEGLTWTIADGAPRAAETLEAGSGSGFAVGSRGTVTYGATGEIPAAALIFTFWPDESACRDMGG